MDRRPSRRLVRRLTMLAAGLALLGGATGAPAQLTAISFESGAGDETAMWRVGVQCAWREFATAGRWQVDLTVELQVGRWEGTAEHRENHRLYDIGITPILRLEQTELAALAPFLEGAVGIHLISRNRPVDGLDMSSAYQFGDHVGAGVRFGPDHRYELAYRHQHLSNGSLVPPNDGINFNQLRVVVYF